MKPIIRLLVAIVMTGAIAFTGLGTEYVTAQESMGFSSDVVAALQATDATEAPAGADGQTDSSTEVSELPSTGRGSVMTAADTHQLVTEQIMLTVMVLAAVVSVAFASLAPFARQKDL